MISGEEYFLFSELNTTASKDDLSSNQLQNITQTIVNDVQLGSSSLKTLINTTGVAISEPPPDPADPNWQTVTQENKDSTFEQLVQPSQMRLHSAIVPLHEGAPFSTQPRFQIYDVNVSICPTHALNKVDLSKNSLSDAFQQS